MSKPNQPTIEMRGIDEVTLWDRNPRRINDKDFARLKKQIAKLGVYKPLIVNQDGIILGGNMRWRALKEMGLKEIAVSVVETKDETEMVEYALSDNDRAGEYVNEELAELAATTDIDLEMFHVDIGRTWSLKDIVSQLSPEEDDVPEPDPDEANHVSKLGEVYQLGRHRLMCGSSTSLEDVEKLMDGKKARMVFTDPPYMVNYSSPGGGKHDSNKFKEGGKIFNDNLSDEEALQFYTDIATNLYAVTTDDAPPYWWYASNKQHLNRAGLLAGGWHVSQTIIWVKESMVLSAGQNFHRIYEPCIVGWKQGKSRYINKLVANMKDVWSLSVTDFAELADVWYQKRDKTNEYVHPTQKPIGLALRAMKRSSQIGDNVIDLFGGSGSTLMACEQANRTCFTMELDPAYCDVIRKRYANSIGMEESWQEATPKISQ